jgi:hypothetical protein
VFVPPLPANVVELRTRITAAVAEVPPEMLRIVWHVPYSGERAAVSIRKEAGPVPDDMDDMDDMDKGKLLTLSGLKLRPRSPQPVVIQTALSRL